MTKMNQKTNNLQNNETEKALVKKSEAQKRGERVRYLREQLLGLSRAGFCKDFDWSPQSLKAWELNWGGGLSKDRAKDLAQHLKKFDIYTTVSWLMHGIGIPPTALTKDFDISEEEEEHIAKELLLFREVTGAVDAIVEDDAMTPIFYPGDYVGGIIVKNPLSALDKQCIVTDAGGHVHIRTLRKGDKENFYHLACSNQNTNLTKEIRNISLKTIAPIVWVRRREPKL